MKHFNVTIGIRGRHNGFTSMLVAAKSPSQAEESALTYTSKHCGGPYQGKERGGLYIACKTLEVVKHMEPHVGPSGKVYRKGYDQ